MNGLAEVVLTHRLYNLCRSQEINRLNLEMCEGPRTFARGDGKEGRVLKGKVGSNLVIAACQHETGSRNERPVRNASS
jgi:hypothetical protein